MSDTAQGPGWWQASNGKWYPPERRPPPPGERVTDMTPDELNSVIHLGSRSGTGAVIVVLGLVAGGFGLATIASLQSAADPNIGPAIGLPFAGLCLAAMVGLIVLCRKIWVLAGRHV